MTNRSRAAYAAIAALVLRRRLGGVGGRRLIRRFGAYLLATAPAAAAWGRKSWASKRSPRSATKRFTPMPANSSMTWSISPLTTLNLKAQSEVAETTVANSAGALAYRGTATLTHAFLRNFTATASLGFSKTDYDGVNRHETGVNAGMRLEYKFNRLMALRGSYAFEKVHVNAAGESYSAHTMMLGIRMTP